MQKLTYERYFYHTLQKGKHIGEIKGFPGTNFGWCHNLKYGSCLQENIRAGVLSGIQTNKEDIRFRNKESELVQSRTESCGVQRSGFGRAGVVKYIGIAEDEPERLARLDGVKKISPLHLIGWTEADARKWCEENDLLSPIYTTATRGGCWFCHNQGVDQLRQLRHNYPDLWALLMKWDLDSPVTFHADGHTVHDFDRRFYLEDIGAMSKDQPFKWETTNQIHMNELLR